MTRALIGYSGFVGSTLLRQTQFDSLYRSTNISEITGRHFDCVVCAGAPAQKWLANREPQKDRAKIDNLMARLETMTCGRFVLISTVDVFARPIDVDEDTRVADCELSPYGANRRRLELFVEARFQESLIVRLPGLVGPGLRKNVVYDLLNDNNVASLDGRAVFQFYPMVNLWSDLAIASEAGLRVVHLTAEPVSVADVAQFGFGRQLTQPVDGASVQYDMRTKFARLFGGAGPYQYDRRASLLAIRTYAQAEPRTLVRAGE